ncbi:Oidioi.mRNA.OKI2018_I69.chr1.g1146.t1.cds [Oikopleura dioica]|uniref:Oidioi.mRNA.OKI2018_I69.chr1.g1146.t1.cds n=1 Tax=Oikopleura dioica TaxID=34765 RepID=A0ABN7SU44_OIKDI|nr:Oidioi.mRNA.OKI2018_I69.chr1.g1146.t1.cds [Oikopleura dioica]
MDEEAIESAFTNQTSQSSSSKLDRGNKRLNLLSILAFLFALFVIIAIISFFAWRCAKRQRDFDFETFVDEPRNSTNRPRHFGTINEAMYQTDDESKKKSRANAEQIEQCDTRRMTKRGIYETRI